MDLQFASSSAQMLKLFHFQTLALVLSPLALLSSSLLLLLLLSSLSALYSPSLLESLKLRTEWMFFAANAVKMAGPVTRDTRGMDRHSPHGSGLH